MSEQAAVRPAWSPCLGADKQTMTTLFISVSLFTPPFTLHCTVTVVNMCQACTSVSLCVAHTALPPKGTNLYLSHLLNCDCCPQVLIKPLLSVFGRASLYITMRAAGRQQPVPYLSHMNCDCCVQVCSQLSDLQGHHAVLQEYNDQYHTVHTHRTVAVVCRC